MRKALLMFSLVLGLAAQASEDDPTLAAAIESAMYGEHRSEENIARNRYRHPVGTLTFFGIAPGMTVMEISPGSGWYTEILAPVMRDIGTLVVASYDIDVPDQPAYRYRQHEALKNKFADRPDIYDQVKWTRFSPPQSMELAPADSVDLLLTFRNLHGWINAGVAQDVFNEFARVLAPGGILGVVQHRAPDGTDPKETARSGYVSEQAVIELARRAGLRLNASSEVNANPRDTRDHPNGVWSLPPNLNVEKNQDAYRAIGESDRMTLRFIKPEKE